MKAPCQKRIADLAGGVRGKAKKRKGAKITIEVFTNKIILLPKSQLLERKKGIGQFRRLYQKLSYFVSGRGTFIIQKAKILWKDTALT